MSCDNHMSEAVPSAVLGKKGCGLGSGDGGGWRGRGGELPFKFLH